MESNELTALVCSGCGARVFACRDHNSVAASVELDPHTALTRVSGGLVAHADRGVVYAVPADMIRADEPTYRWHTLAFTYRGRLVTNIACGRPVENRHRGLRWLDCCPLRFP